MVFLFCFFGRIITYSTNMLILEYQNTTLVAKGKKTQKAKIRDKK